MVVVSGVGAKGTSALWLSGGQGLGPEGAGRLAGLLLEARPPLLASLDLRQPRPPRLPAQSTPSLSQWQTIADADEHALARTRTRTHAQTQALLINEAGNRLPC
jgi:hypothetical protein